MSMKHPFLFAGALGFAGIVAGSAMTYVDSIAGRANFGACLPMRAEGRREGSPL